MGLTNASLESGRVLCSMDLRKGSGMIPEHAWSKAHHLHTMVADAGCESESLGSREGLGTSSHPKHHCQAGSCLCTAMLDLLVCAQSQAAAIPFPTSQGQLLKGCCSAAESRLGTAVSGWAGLLKSSLRWVKSLRASLRGWERCKCTDTGIPVLTVLSSSIYYQLLSVYRQRGAPSNHGTTWLHTPTNEAWVWISSNLPALPWSL